MTKSRFTVIAASVLFCAGILLALAMFFAGHGIAVPVLCLWENGFYSGSCGLPTISRHI